MKFETEYKNIRFLITLEKDSYADVSLIMGDKFNRLPNQTMIEVKKGNLIPYNLILTSIADDEEYTHYLSAVLLTANEEELLEDLADYLEQEQTLDDILALRSRYATTPGPIWRETK